MSQQIRAYYFDGQNSVRHDVLLQVVGSGRLRIYNQQIDLWFERRDIDIPPQVGATACRVYLPSGGICEVINAADGESLLRALGEHRRHKTLRFIEERWLTALAALVLTIGSVWGLLHWGVPTVAERVALALPADTERALAFDGLNYLDEAFFKPTALSEERQQSLHRLFSEMQINIPGAETYQLELRRSPIVGANAFALPAGIVMVTDELVALADDDAAIIGVLAHEIGHVHHRHILRHLLQGSISTLVVAGLLGDITSISSLAAALPTALLDARYSREFETQADTFAIDYMVAHQIDTQPLAALFVKLAHDDGDDSDSNQVAGYLSSHPATADRVRRLAPNGDR